jgi:hypothetical protein
VRIIILVVIVAIALGAIGIFIMFVSQMPASSNTKDAIGDAVIVRVHEAVGEPVVQPYHDIVSASVQRLNARELLLAVELDGDPNANTSYETVYLWVIDYPTIAGNRKYTIIVPHLPPELGTSTGWHIAIFDHKANGYIVPLKKIGAMPQNMVEVNIDPAIIGNPSFFYWQTFVMVRVEPQFDRPPDFLIDSAPDNDTVLLSPFS